MTIKHEKTSLCLTFRERELLIDALDLIRRIDDLAEEHDLEGIQDLAVDICHDLGNLIEDLA